MLFPYLFLAKQFCVSSVEQFQLLNFSVCVSRSTCEEYSYNFRGHAKCVARGMEGQLGTSAKKQRENVGIFPKSGTPPPCLGIFYRLFLGGLPC